MGLSTHVFKTAGDAVMSSSSLREVLDSNPYETRTKRALWDRIATRLWDIKCSEEHISSQQV